MPIPRKLLFPSSLILIRQILLGPASDAFFLCYHKSSRGNADDDPSYAVDISMISRLT